jgi:serine/threonine-protein kinase
MADNDRTLLAAGLPLYDAAQPHRSGSALPPATTTGSAIATATPWKREAFPDVEAVLARQIGPVAKFLLRKVADQADSLDALTALLLPHIPSELGRVEFQAALVQVKKKLEATGTGSGVAPAPTLSGTGTGPGSRSGMQAAQTAIAAPVAYDDAYADAVATRLVNIIGPIGRVVVKRAVKATGEKQAFLQLVATHIDNPAERARFLLDASAL